MKTRFCLKYFVNDCRLIPVCRIQWWCPLFLFSRGNMVQKLKSLSLARNLVFRLILICTIQWCCLLFLFLMGNTLGKFDPKKSKLSARDEIWYLHNSNMQNSVLAYFFQFPPALLIPISTSTHFQFLINTLLVQICFKKKKIVSLSWNLISRLI